MPRTLTPDARHTAFMAELKAAVGNTGKDIVVAELLAIASQFVGQLLAMQDQTKTTPAMAMDLVARNLEIGNAEAVRAFLELRAAGRA